MYIKIVEKRLTDRIDKTDKRVEALEKLVKSLIGEKQATVKHATKTDVQTDN